jgi:small subunit ribosomal protein S20
MPNTKQAEKRMRRDAKRRLRNRYHLSRMKTYIRNLKKLIAQGKLEEAKEYLPKVISVIQHTASKGVIHKNEASRRCSRVQKLLNQAFAKAQGGTQ